MVDKDLLELIACPQNHQELREAPGEVLERLNARIAQGALSNQGGTKLSAPLSEGLLRADDKVLYPIVEGIPMLLAEEAIAVE